MEKIGNIEIKELSVCEKEQLESEYYDILEKVKINPFYFDDEVGKKKNSWIEIKEMLKYRRNIIDWISIDKDADVLEIMSGCGALTQGLASKANTVTCVELSKTKSIINAYRNQKNENVEIYVSSYDVFSDNVQKQYDYIIWLDGFVDYKTIAPNYDSSKQLLKDLKQLLKDNGTIICAVNNPFGLRYIAGAPDDITGQYFEGITGFPNAKRETGYTRDSFIQLFEESAYMNIECYYPYPDYMFPLAIYSDDRMPQKGELLINTCNFQNDRLLLFDEQRAFDNIIQNKMFSQFSNSYLIMAQKE